MNIEIPAEQWGAMIGQAVMQSVTEANRDLLVKGAITHLLTPEKHSAYGQQRSPLQQAFDVAIAKAAQDEVRKRFDELLAPKVQEIVEESLIKAFESGRRETLINNVADSIVKAFRVADY